MLTYTFMLLIGNVYSGGELVAAKPTTAQQAFNKKAMLQPDSVLSIKDVLAI